LAEDAMTPNPYRNHIRFFGAGDYRVTLRTNGWFEGVETIGFGSGDRYDASNKREVAISVGSRPAQPREVVLNVRPIGAPVWIEGTRDGRKLANDDLWLGKSGVHPTEASLRLPGFDTDKDRVGDIFVVAKHQNPGIHLWLTLLKGRGFMNTMDCETCERLKALGYLGNVDCGCK